MAAAATFGFLHPLIRKPLVPPLYILPLPTQPHAKTHPRSLPLLFLLPRRRRGGPIAALPNTTSSSTNASASPTYDVREAEAAVADLLREGGASADDAAAIAARAPAYAAMLADGVRELDELGLWASWSSGASARLGLSGVVEMEMGRLGFRRKVYLMGRSRPDHGVVPLLESLGVRLSSAKLIAPYVASAGLTVLIDRVRDAQLAYITCVDRKYTIRLRAVQGSFSIYLFLIDALVPLLKFKLLLQSFAKLLTKIKWFLKKFQG
jgi:mTERF domain-containing protein, mitochondrial